MKINHLLQLNKINNNSNSRVSIDINNVNIQNLSQVNNMPIETDKKILRKMR